MTVGLGTVRGAGWAPRAIVFLLAMAGLSPATAAAEAPRHIPEANLIRLEGYLGPPRRGTKPIADLLLDYQGKQYRFQATQVRLLTGKRGDSTRTFGRASQPRLFLRGGGAMLQRLTTAPPLGRIEITGYQQRGSHDLLVTEVAVAPPQTAASTPTPPTK